MANNANPMKFIDISDVHSLMLRKEYLTKQYEDSKAALENFNKNLENIYLDKAKKQLFSEGKDFGTVNFKDGDVSVKVELRKKTSWDQESLLNYLNTLPNDLAKHYSKVTITVPEARFINATPDIKKELRKHRTVDLQGVKITFGGNE
jgi:DNA polymerase/3'-5' exonuclease PolX